MKYMLVLFADESGWENVTPEDMQAGMEPWDNFERELRDSGAHVAGEGLRPSSEARTVKLVADGEPLVTDGPFAETKEQLGGFYLIDVPILTRRSSGRRRCRYDPARRSRCDP